MCVTPNLCLHRVTSSNASYPTHDLLQISCVGWSLQYVGQSLPKMASPLRRQVTVPANRPGHPSTQSPFPIPSVCLCVWRRVRVPSDISSRPCVSDLSVKNACKNACCFTFSISPLGDSSVGGALTPPLALLKSYYIYIYICYCERILTIKGRCGAQSQNPLNMVRRGRRFGVASGYPPLTHKAHYPTVPSSLESLAAFRCTFKLVPSSQ